MRESERFRTHAKECESLAGRAISERDRQAFQGMAREWRDLERKALEKEAAEALAAGMIMGELNNPDPSSNS